MTDVKTITRKRYRSGHVVGVWLAAFAALVGVSVPAAGADALAPHGQSDASAAVTLTAVTATATRHCAAFTVKKVSHGKVVRRHGNVVYTKRTVCVTVSSAACRVRWVKQRRHGRIVIKKHNPVWIARVSCPTPRPGPVQPTPPAAGPGNARVAVYEVTAQGVTFIDNDLTESLPAQSGIPVESFTQHGYLVQLLTPFPGLNGPTHDEVGLFLGSLIGFSENAGTTQFGTNTMMFTAANAGDPTIFQNLPFPYDIGQAALQGDKLVGYADLQSIRQVTPPAGMAPDYFVDRSGLVPGQIKSVNAGVVVAQFPSVTDTSTLTGAFELQGGVSFTTTLPNPSEIGLFGIRASFTGTRITPPNGAPIYLPPPKPSTPHPPGCRTELHLVPGLGDGTLREQLVTVCR